MRQRNLEAQGRVENLGLGGAALTLAHPVRLGECVGVRFWGEQAVELEAEVAWVAWTEGGVRAGLRFRVEQASTIGDLLALIGPNPTSSAP